MPDSVSQDGDERVRVGAGSSYIMRGGKVDPEAIRRALEEQSSRAESGEEGGGEGGEDDSEIRRVVFEIRRDLKKRLDKYLTDRITFMSRSRLQRLIDEGGVLVNEKVPKASTLLHAGDVVEVVVPPPPERNIVPEAIPLDVLFEDDSLIVVNKQADIIVHPARSHLRGTMLSALAYHLMHGSGSGGGLSSVGKEIARPGVVHRLDRHTTGVIVFAKQDEAHWKLGHQFEHRRVDKRYLALVHGRVEPDVDVIELPVGPHPSKEKGYREKYVVRHDELGKPSTTVARVRERYTIPRIEGLATAEYTLVELELRTGRTHQIRVHLSHEGWAIVGDDMYGGRALGLRGERGEEVLVGWNANGMGPDASAPPKGVEGLMNRQALHACMLAFQHPVSGAAMRFEAPFRGDMARLVHTLRRLSGGGVRVEAQGATIDVERVIGEDPEVPASGSDGR